MADDDRAPDAVAIGFCCLFSNSLLLGLPITERAYGPEALAGNFAIISIHAPLLYAFGITMMEWARSRETPVSGGVLARQIATGIVTNPMVIGIGCGVAWNLAGLPLAGALDAAEGDGRAGCETALDYLELNLPGVGALSGASCLTGRGLCFVCRGKP